MVRLPGWLVFVLFVPFQIWVFLEMRAAWGLWPTVLSLAVIGLVAARAARASWLQRWLMPQRAERKERRRPIWSGVLLVLAAASFFLPWGPQPWLPAAAAVSLVKANVS